MSEGNIFDDDSTQFHVLVNADGQHSLWPAPIPVPAGWTPVFGPEARSAALDYVTEHWLDMRPSGLVEAADEEPPR